MRPAPTGYAEALDAGALQVWSRVSAWRGATLLAADVPVVAGSVTGDAAGAVPDAVEVAVPAFADGRRWDPHRDPFAPLNTYGQRLRVQAGYIVEGRPLVLDLGWFRIDDYEVADGTVLVRGSGLLAELAAPNLLFSPIDAGGRTAASVLAELVRGQSRSGPSPLPVSIDPALPARTLPAGTILEGDRLAAAYSVVDTWPARIVATPAGTVRVRAPFSPAAASVRRWVEGVAGTSTITGWAGGRTGVVNVWRIFGEDSAGGSLLAVVEDTDASSPTYVPAFGPAVEDYTSPMIDSVDRARDIGRARLAGSRSNRAPVTWTGVPDHRIELDDVHDYVTEDGEAFRARITGYALPLGAPAPASYTGVVL